MLRITVYKMWQHRLKFKAVYPIVLDGLPFLGRQLELQLIHFKVLEYSLRVLIFVKEDAFLRVVDPDVLHLADK